MKRPNTQKHWTESSILDYQSRITFDFLAQLEKKMESLQMTQVELARKLEISESAVSQVLNNPAGLNLSTIIKYSRKIGLKVAIVAYDDNDPENTNGPINSEIFSACWEKQGRPSDFFELAETDIQEEGSQEIAKNNVVWISEHKAKNGLKLSNEGTVSEKVNLLPENNQVAYLMAS